MFTTFVCLEISWQFHSVFFPQRSSSLINLDFRLNYGLDYKGNICGDKHADPDLRELEVRYWMNPNQIYQSGVKDSQFKLSDARSVCLMECPMPSEDSINWVCDYPDGDIKISMDEWIDRDYDYYEFLTPDMRNSSLQLQGPCYPVIFPSVNGQFLGQCLLPLWMKTIVFMAAFLLLSSFSLLELPVD